MVATKELGPDEHPDKMASNVLGVFDQPPANYPHLYGRAKASSVGGHTRIYTLVDHFWSDGLGPENQSKIRIERRNKGAQWRLMISIQSIGNR